MRLGHVVLSSAGAAMLIACGAFGSTNDGEPRPTADGGADAIAVVDAGPETPPGSKTTIELAKEEGVYGIAVDSNAVYWTNPTLKHVQAIAKPGKTSLLTGTVLQNFPEVRDIHVDANDIFVCRSACTLAEPTAFRLSKGEKKVTGIVPCGYGPCVRLTIDANSVLLNVHNGNVTTTYLAQKVGGNRAVQFVQPVPAGPLALSGAHIYWVTNDKLVSEELDAGTRATGTFIDLAANATLVVWIDGNGAIYRATHDGASEPEKLATDPGTGGRVVIHRDVIYWTNNSEGRVLSVPVSGGTPTVIASGEKGPFAIAVDDDGVYWTNRGDGTVRMAPR